MLTTTKPEFVLTAGTAFHTGMDWMYRTEGKKIGVPPLFNKDVKLTPEEEQESYYWHQILWILTKAYRHHYKDDFTDAIKIVSLEQVLKVVIDGILHCGALDLVVERNERTEIWDHKTKGMKSAKSSAVDEWRTRFQFLLYTFMWNVANPDKPIRRFVANVIMKPAISLKQNETLQGFFRRLQLDVNQRRADYFKRESVPVDSRTMQTFYQNFLRPRIANMKMLQTVKEGTREYEALVLHRNSANCYAFGRMCPFYGHCHNGKKLEELPNLRKRKVKHEHYEEKEL